MWRMKHHEHCQFGSDKNEGDAPLLRDLPCFAHREMVKKWRQIIFNTLLLPTALFSMEKLFAAPESDMSIDQQWRERHRGVTRKNSHLAHFFSLSLSLVNNVTRSDIAEW